MEDYEAAFAQRMNDIEVLLDAAPARGIAAVHLGGSAIECRLKALILHYHGIKKWGDPSTRKGDVRHRKAIGRTGHALIGGVKVMNELYRKALTDKYFIEHLGNITYPRGSSQTDFISLRYASKDFSDQELKEWRRSLDYVVGWLKKNEAYI